MSAIQDRENAVVLLATTLFDYLPVPRLPVLADAGLAEGAYVPCNACEARGRVLGPGVVCVRCPPRRGPQRPAPAFGARHGCRPCLACGGDGWRHRRPSETPWDAYAGLPIRTKTDKRPPRTDEAHERAQQTAQQLAHTTLYLKLFEGDDTLDETWEERRKQQFSSGHYAELVAAMRHVERLDRLGIGLFNRVYVVHEPLTLSAHATRLVGEATTLIAWAMPAKIRLPHALRPASAKKSLWHGRTDRHAEQRNGRNGQIVALASSWTSSQIAIEFGVTERRVRQIVGSAA